MTSARKRETNRLNAQASTGPKTARGKLRAAQNARRHGLSLPIHLVAGLSADAENLAVRFAGEGASPEILERARRVADAQIDLMRVRQARLELFGRYIKDPEYRPAAHINYLGAIVDFLGRQLRQFGPECSISGELAQSFYHSLYWKPEGAQKLTSILRELTTKLAAVDRYERRALSRRKFAIRELDLARRETSQRNSGGA